MFRTKTSLVLLIALIAAVEYYCFTAVNVALRTAHNAVRITILCLYVLLSIGAWYSLTSYRGWNMAAWPSNAKNLFIAFLIGFFVAKTLMATLMLLDDMRRLFTWVARHFTKVAPQLPDSDLPAQGIDRSTFLARFALLVGAFTVGGFAYGTTNRYRYQINKIKLKLNKLPKAFKGLKIVQISDIHSGSFDNHKAVAHGIDLIMQQNPDLIVFTGDLVNNEAKEIESYKEIFGRLKAPLGVFSTLGNHDYGDYIQWPSLEAKAANLEQLKQHHADMGWRLLMNEHVVLERGNDKIALLGVENWSAMARFPKHGKLADAYKGLEDADIPVKILLSHDPTHWDAEIRPHFKDIDVTLSGHTHGMQFGIKLSWMKWSPVQYVYKQWAGLYKENNQHLYVNVGFGYIGYSGRLGILPEITVIELE
jgi:predicted MPP superfamily phosphohydrolase